MQASQEAIDVLAFFRKFCRDCSRLSMSAISELASSNTLGLLVVTSAGASDAVAAAAAAAILTGLTGSLLLACSASNVGDG